MIDRLARRILVATLGHMAEGRLDVHTPTGSLAFGEASSPRSARLDVLDERVFRRVLTGGDVGFGEAYVNGEWSSPDLVALVRLAIRNLALFEDRNRAFSAIGRWRDLAMHRLRPNSRRGSQSNIHRHYDIGNEFYRLFLDRSMAYSSGIYRSASDSLEQAQEEKFDRICRKLRLGPPGPRARDRHRVGRVRGVGGDALRLPRDDDDDQRRAASLRGRRCSHGSASAAIACACCSRTIGTCRAASTRS